MGDLIRRIRFLFHRRRLSAELENDMEFHREMAALAGVQTSATRFASANSLMKHGAGRGLTGSCRTYDTVRGFFCGGPGLPLLR